eukprot:484335_1
MSDEKKSNIDDEEYINDGYKYVKEKDKLLASISIKRSKQNDSIKDAAKIEIMKKLMAVTRNEETDDIQKCIGQITISFDGSENTYRYGTGTIYKHLGGKYYLVITCAHNLVYFDDIKNGKEKAKKLFYLPNGVQDQNNRLVCIDWIAHKDYNARIDHCENDIGIILCYDAKKYYKKNNINVNESIRIDTCIKDKIKRCKIFGYPVKCEGQLLGKEGTATKDNNYNEWKYSNINTYPGHSGAALYKLQELDDVDVFIIYGIHIFGNMQQNINRGVYLNNNRLEWIENTENKMNEKMIQHKESRKKKKHKKTANEITAFLASIGLSQYCKNFDDRGLELMDDLNVVDNDFLVDTLLITDFRDMRKIVKAIKNYKKEPSKQDKPQQTISPKQPFNEPPPTQDKPVNPQSKQNKLQHPTQPVFDITHITTDSIKKKKKK